MKKNDPELFDEVINRIDQEKRYILKEKLMIKIVNEKKRRIVTIKP